MIEATLYYDDRVGTDENEIAESVKQFLLALKDTPGLKEVKNYENLMGNPVHKTSIYFKKLEDWAKFRMSGAYIAAYNVLVKQKVNLRVDIWDEINYYNPEE